MSKQTFQKWKLNYFVKFILKKGKIYLKKKKKKINDYRIFCFNDFR